VKQHVSFVVVLFPLLCHYHLLIFEFSGSFWFKLTRIDSTQTAESNSPLIAASLDLQLFTNIIILTVMWLAIFGGCGTTAKALVDSHIVLDNVIDNMECFCKQSIF